MGNQYIPFGSCRARIRSLMAEGRYDEIHFPGMLEYDSMRHYFRNYRDKTKNMHHHGTMMKHSIRVAREYKLKNVKKKG